MIHPNHRPDESYGVRYRLAEHHVHNYDTEMCISRRITLFLPVILLAVCGVASGNIPGDPAYAESLKPTSPKQPGAIDEARMAQADAEPQNWYATNRTFAADHYSPLSQINDSNAERLGFAWQYNTGTTRGLEASPVVIDGVMYATGNWGVVYALDAATGRELWTFNPHVDGRWARRACCDIVNRGVAVWKGRVYVAALDGRLFALDAGTGRQIWVRDTIIDHDRFLTSTGAPQIAGGNVVIGNGGAEMGVRGYLTAFDAETGAFAWRFFIVPADPSKPQENPELAIAAPTWGPKSRWDVGGGGAAWDAMAYDPELNLLYVGTGNGSPHPAFVRSPGGGDTLFVSSILALNPKTGRMKWYYQTTPRDSWDFTATQQMTLLDLRIGGTLRKVLVQAPKNGFFYVLDRATGELISAEKYTDVNWADHIDMKTGRPVFTAQGDYSREPKLVYPGEAGGHNWRPMSYSRRTGYVYIPTLDFPMVFSLSRDLAYHRGTDNSMDVTDRAAISRAQKGEADIPVIRHDTLQAYDPVHQRAAWSVVTSTDPEQSGGVLSTGGDIVAQGDATGFLNIYDARTGAPLSHIRVGTGIMAAPVSYAVAGRQYIAVMAGLGGASAWEFPENSAGYRYGNAGRIVVFALDGGAVPTPALVNRSVVAISPPSGIRTSPEMITRGARLFDSARCSGCHVPGKAGIAPNLLAMQESTHRAFDQIVLGGALSAAGMASFSDILTQSDADDIHAYLASEAKNAATLHTAVRH